MKKKILMLVCAFCFVIPAVLFGLTACGTKDTEKPKEPTKPEAPTISLEYELINDGTEYSVVGLGNYNETTLSIPNGYKNKPVTTIGYAAFYNSSLTSVTIGNNVKTIGDHAFYNCSSLISVTIEDRVETIGESAFEDCYSLTSVTTGGSVETIGDYAFRDCYSLTNVTIGNNVKTIGKSAFQQCTSLEEVEYTGPIDRWVSIDFSDQLANPLIFGANLMDGENLIEEIYINTKEIKPYVFWGCSSLTSVTTGGSVETIGDYAFRNCSSLTSVTENVWEDNIVKTIGANAFENCSSLTSLTIGNSLETIGANAFSGCENLNDIKYAGDINDWVSIDFANSAANPLLSFGAKLKINNEVVTTANITTTEIKPYAFNGYVSLTGVVLGDTVELVGSEAFKNCYELKNVTVLSNCLTTIGQGAFSAISIKNIKIPESVTTIGSDAFNLGKNNGLEEVVYAGDINDWVLIDFANSAANPLCNGAALKINNEIVTTANITTTEIKPYAFYDYGFLTSITLDESVKTIGKSAFFANLSSYTDGSDVEEVNYTGDINDWISINFADRSANPLGKGVKLIINNEVVTTANITATEIKPYAFCGYDQLTSVNLENGVTTIGDCAFAGCINLNSINFPNTVITIGDNAFKECRALTSVILGYNVTTVGYGAFDYCSNLESITIGNNVTNIGNTVIASDITVFRNCSSLTTVIIDSETVANALVENSSLGYLVANAQTIYVKSGLSVSNSTYLLLNYTKQTTSDKVGYDMYVKNA